MGFRVQDLRVWGSGFDCLGLIVVGLGLGVVGLGRCESSRRSTRGSGTCGLRPRIKGSEFRSSGGGGSRFEGLGLDVVGLGLRVEG